MISYSNLYFIKKRDGLLHRFYYENGQGICSEILDKNTWTSKTVIAEYAKDNFIVLLKDNDEIEILFENSNGNIEKINCSKPYFEREVIFYRTSSLNYELHLSASYECNNLHIVYNIPDKIKEEHALVHQVLSSDGLWDSPKIIDILSKSTKPSFKILCFNNDLYLLYTKTKNKEMHLVYRKYNSAAKTWGGSSIIDKSSSLFPDYSFVPALENLHILYIKKEGLQDKLLYKTCNSDAAPLLIYQGLNMNYCALALAKDSIHAGWTCEKNTYSCSFPLEEKYYENKALTIDTNNTNALKAQYIFNSNGGAKVKPSQDILVEAEGLNSLMLPDEEVCKNINSFDYIFETSINDIDLYFNKIKNIFIENQRQLYEIKKDILKKNNEIDKLNSLLFSKDAENEKLQNAIKKLKVSIESISKLNFEFKDKNLFQEQKIFNLEQKLQLQKYRLQGYQEQIEVLTKKNVFYEKEIEMLKKQSPALAKQEVLPQEIQNQNKHSLLKWIFEDDINE